ncbi:MAG: SMI1/KNR4 family protein [Woeseiaceae bacterium]|nr:SMI1/KNR4 family protein [Woeseiaceae bacterium]
MIEIEPGTAAQAADIESIRSAEDEIGFRLPESYVEFILSTNGGIPKRRYFNSERGPQVVERFLSFVPDYKVNELGDYDVEVVWTQIWDRLESGLCPFAALFAGDFLCFTLDDPGNGRVVLWDHELSDYRSPALTPIAENFEALVEMLSEEY